MGQFLRLVITFMELCDDCCVRNETVIKLSSFRHHKRCESYTIVCVEEVPQQITRRDNPMANELFEIIEEEEVTSVSRGRKSSVDPQLIEGLRGLTKGKAIRIPSQKLDPKADNYKTEKARISAMLRTAMRAAGHHDFSIIFTPEGVPQIKMK